MFKKLRRVAKNMELVIDSLRPDNIFEVECHNNVQMAAALMALSKEMPLKINAAGIDNPDFYNIFDVCVAGVIITGAGKENLRRVLLYAFVESSFDKPKEELWLPLLGTYAAMQGKRHFIIDSGSGKRFYLNMPRIDAEAFLAGAIGLFGAIGLNVELSLAGADAEALKNILEKRLAAAIEVYIDQDAAWTRNFYDNLGDDLSRQALLSFLSQRMYGKVFFDCDNLYALTLTAQSAQWRQGRLSSPEAWPVLIDTNFILVFLILNTFIFEQYAIPGVAEARPGDNILDAGAASGDTVIYFSQKAGAKGKVFAFEPLPENIAFMRRNIRLHGCENVIIEPCALSGHQASGWVFHDEFMFASNAIVYDEKRGDSQPVNITTIDDFAKDIRIDFIKADIEGGEAAMLAGGAKVIARDKPVCALALYHKENDFRELPQALARHNPDYVFYVRMDAEPMLFAVPKDRAAAK